MFFSLASMLSAQEFVDTLFFRDAVGNRDTIIIGYDPLATDSIDEQFGEQHIPLNADDTIFSVRTADKWDSSRVWQMGPPYYKQWWDYVCNYKLKKQIVKKKCPDSDYRIFNITIVCKNFPVTVSWKNKSIYNDSCRIQTLMTSVDFSSTPYSHYLKDKDSVLFNEDMFKIIRHTSYYDTIIGSPVKTYCLKLGIGTFWSYNRLINKENNINIFPNPFINIFNIETNNTPIQHLEIYNNVGIKIIDCQVTDEKLVINMSQKPSGIYFIKLINETGFYVYKILKN